MNPSIKMFKKFAAFVCCAVFMCSITSCSEEDNPVNPIGSASIALNTQALYEELGLYPRVNSSLGSYFYIEGTLLVYNEQGNLVKKYVKKAEDLQPIQFDVSDLPNGDYTVVAAQLGRQEEVTMWELVDEENLSTVQIRPTGLHVYWPFALGTDSQMIHVEGGKAEASLTSKSAGCLFDVLVDRTEAFNYFIRLYLENAPVGISLNPQLNNDERLVYGEENTWSGLCQVDPATTSMSYFTLAKGDLNLFVEYWDANESQWQNLWWGQKMHFGPDSPSIFYYDSYPQLMYKSFVGSQEKFKEWKQEHDANGLLLKPIMEYGLNVEDFDRIVTSAPWFCGPQQSELRPDIGSWWAKSYVVWPDGKLQLLYRFEAEDGKNGIECIYQYGGTDIPVEQMKAEVVKWGYEYKGYFYAPNDSNMISYVYLMPDGQDEIQLWYNVTAGYWQVAFHPYDQEDFDLLIPE